VNPDASRSFAARDSGGTARHATAGRTNSSGSAGRQRIARRGGPVARNPRHSKSGRGRSSRRSEPGHGSAHTGTAGPTAGRCAPHGRPADDERGRCCDIAPAYVPSTVWSTAPKRNSPVGFGAVRAADGAASTATSPAALAQCQDRPRSRAARGWRPLVGASPLPTDAIPGQLPNQRTCHRNYADSHRR